MYNRVTERIVKMLVDVVGDENVHTEEAILIGYTRDAGISDESVMPEVVVRPASTQEVSAIVKIANKEKIPITVISSGKDIGDATHLPTCGGILLDLKRMDKIVEVNEKFRYVVVEPGVTFYQLYREIWKRGLNWRFAVPSAPPATTIVGNYVGVGGVGFTVRTAHFNLVSGMEIVLPNGEVVYTGPKKAPYGVSWGFGPLIDGLFVQGNFGIITKLGIKPLKEWECFDWFIYSVDRFEDVVSCVDFSMSLFQKGIMRGCYTLYNWLALIASVETYPWEITEGKRSLPEDVRRRFMEKHGVGWWVVLGGLCGTKENVERRLSLVEKEAKKYPALSQLDKKEVLKIPEIDHKLKAMQGLPTRAESNWLSWRGGGLVWYSSQPIMDGKEALMLARIYEQIHSKYGFDYSTKYVLPTVQSGFLLFKQPKEKERARKAYMEIIEKTLDAGFIIRRYDVYAEPLILSRLGPLRDVFSRIKEAFDPNRIINPGMHIW